MAKRKEKALSELSENELHAKIYELDKEIFELRNELALQRKIEKPHLIKAKRREKARILTTLTQKQNEKEAV